MPTLNSWGNQVLTANVTLNGGTCDIGSDATSGAINIGTGSAARTTTIGNGTGASSVVLNCGTGALNLGSNAIARTTTLGNTTGASVLALKYGTGDFTLASATGTVMSALDTGEITCPLQPSFLAYETNVVSNVTGDTTEYRIIYDTELFDVGSDYNLGTGQFTCPVTGKYFFNYNLNISGITAGMINGYITIVNGSTGIHYMVCNCNIYAMSILGNLQINTSLFLSCTAGDTIYPTVQINDGAKVVDISAGSHLNHFSGHLVC
jgi:hypothetical protein